MFVHAVVASKANNSNESLSFIYWIKIDVMSDNLLEQLPELIDAGHLDRLLGTVRMMDGRSETDDR